MIGLSCAIDGRSMSSVGCAGSGAPSRVRWCVMHILGLDAAGPANERDTSLVTLAFDSGRLRFQEHLRPASDATILARVTTLLSAGSVVLGIDAPLSYAPGGGDRPGDRELRARAREAGLASGSVMAPTSPRMAYLTLRGVALSRALLIEAGGRDLRIVEVHPGAALVLSGASAGHVREMKRNAVSRAALLSHLGSCGMDDLRDPLAEVDHDIAALAAALAAWRWSIGRGAFLRPAAPPEHPFDFAA